MNYALCEYELHVKVHFQILKEPVQSLILHFTAAQDTLHTTNQSLWQYIWRKK